MKIAFISPHTFTYPGGVQKHTFALKKEFEKKGHQVKLILPREKIPQKVGKDTILLGGALYVSGNASKTNLSLNLNPFSISRKLRKEKFDVLHFQNLGFFLPLQILELSLQLPKKPLNILTFHAFLDASRLFKELPTLIAIFNNYISKKLDGLIGVSKPVFSQIKYDGCKEIIPNGIDIDFFNPKGDKIKKFDDRYLNLLFVGRIEKRKGLIYLLKAFAKLKENYKYLRLIVVGRGHKEEDMKEFIAKNKISDIFFEGEVSEKELPKYYRTADICCFPSIYGEAFGIVLLEAMASEKSVVAFANFGYKEVLVGKGAKFLAEPRDVKELAEKLEILIKSKAKRKEMGKWGRKEAKKYSWDKIAARTLEFYEKARSCSAAINDD